MNMRLETERLNMTIVKVEDLSEVHQLNSYPEVDEFNTLGLPANEKVTEKIMNEWLQKQNENPRQSYVFCVRLKENGKFAGMIAMNLGRPKYRSAEISYKLRPDHWRNGYATEAVKALLSFGFRDLCLHRIEAGCAIQNAASIKVLEKVGMVREGSKRKILPIRGQWVDNFIYSILEEEFLSQ
jgi:ribosomal-protein-alanine N-acetyltransferase